MNSVTFPDIPLETTKAALAIFGRSNFYMLIGDQANKIFDGLFLGGPTGDLQKSAHSLATLYLITIFQYIETLPDLLATEALHQRVEWKYALHLPLSHPGLAASSLCLFRQWLKKDRAGQQSLEALMLRLTGLCDFPVSDSPFQVARHVCQVSRLARMWDALIQAIEALAARHPRWLLATSLPHWYQRYSAQPRHINLGADRLERHALTHTIGADGFYLLKAIGDAHLPALSDLPEVQNLERIWQEQYQQLQGSPVWRDKACASCTTVTKPAPPASGDDQDS